MNEAVLADLKASIEKREQRLNDPHGDGTGRDSKCPTGGDYNDLLSDVLFALAKLEVK